MSKKSAKIAVTYFTTIIASLAVVGGVSWFMLGPYLMGEAPKTPDVPLQTTAPAPAAVNTSEYVPSIEDAQTVLGIYDAGDRSSAVTFVLFRFLPSETKLMVVPLRSDILSREGTATIYDLYRSGGAQFVCRTIEGIIGYPVNKYVCLTDSSFQSFSDMCGSVTFDIPYNLIYESDNFNDNTVIKAGEQILDSRTLRKVLIYPNYTGGEEYRSTVVGELVVAMMNNGSKGVFSTSLESVYDELANSDALMDISRYDFLDIQPAIEYTLAHNSAPAQLVLPSGTQTDAGCVLDESFLEALPRYFE